MGGICRGALFLLFISHTLAAVIESNSITTMDILMKGAKPLKPDAYLCTSYRIDGGESYIVEFEALADVSTVHHILVYGCAQGPFSNENIWNCPPICQDGSQQIIFAWAKNAPPTHLPEGVGFRIGQKTTIQTIVLQIHYAKAFQEYEIPDRSGIRLHITDKKQPFVAGIFLLLSGSFNVPAQTQKYHVDVSCSYDKEYNIIPFAYRTHAHGLGRVITGYQYNGTYQLIGKGNPQWPQAFYPTTSKIEVKPGDKLAARCTYNSTGINHMTDVGSTGNDEMCNFYIMFYTNSTVKEPSGECLDNEIPTLIQTLPLDSDVPLPPNPLLEEEAHGHNHHSPPEIDKLAPTTARAGDRVFDSTKWKNVHLGKPLGNQEPNSREHSHHFYSQKPQESVFIQEPNRLAGSSGFHGSDIPEGKGINKEYLPEPEVYEKMMDELGPIALQKRIGTYYYDEYFPSSEREDRTEDDSNSGLSRNRIKAFEAINKELKDFQHIKPHSEIEKTDLPLSDKIISNKKTGSLLPLKTSALETLDKLKFENGWPEDYMKLGQVAGLATDKDGNVYIFHRGSRKWEVTSFDWNSNFQFQDKPIIENTLVIYNREGKLLRTFGSGKFFMPHGIEVDKQGNIWLTDVALHQVFRIPFNGTEPDLTLGEKFVHGSDESHFCKPTDIAVLSSGEFFVTDGYCNSRVLKFSKEGRLLKQWGKADTFTAREEPPPGTFNIPHSVSVAEDLNLLFVADRENGRIQCFDLEGNFQYKMSHMEFGSRLFAVEYCAKHDGLLYAVNGPPFNDGSNGVTVQGFTLDAKTGALLEQWTVSQGLHEPHDVAVDPSGDSVYVGELSPLAVWKLSRQHDNIASQVATAGPTRAPMQIEKSNISNDNSMHKEHMNHAGASFGGKGNLSQSMTNKLKTEDVDGFSGLSTSMIVGMLLVVPVVLLLVTTLLMRMNNSEWPSCCLCKKTQKVFSLQNFLSTSHKGFDKLSQDDSDHDADGHSDSENEEFNRLHKSKA